MAAKADSVAESSGSIRFVMDGEIVEIAGADPNRTVLQYLREDLGRTGTKEGCAEGDCGACTVVVTERDGDGLSVRAVNSCIQFLPTLDGRELITVESLAGNAADLHPVQRAMVEQHGSQCGFCTPGFVMSLFATYKTIPNPSRRDIDDALAGNLCRCTGYRPIVAAAGAMYEADAEADDWLRRPAGGGADEERLAKLRSLERGEAHEVRGAGRRWYAPVDADALAAILDGHPDATLVAGGTDVGLWVTKQHRELPVLVYTRRVRELRRTGLTDTHLEIGAAVTLAEAVPLILEHYPRLDEMFRRFASPPIRNAATLGGNVANGSPIGDSMPALMAAGATVVLRSSGGTRELTLEDLYVDYRVTAMKKGEFIETIRIPRPSASTFLASYKVSKRFDQDISAVCAAYCLELDGDVVKTVRIACGGVAATIRRAVHCEAALRDEAFDESAIARAAEALSHDFEPISDMRASADYRLRVCRNLLQRLWLDVRGELGETVYGHGR